MTAAEQWYSVYDQELLALISALQKWRRLLLLADVTAYTDHRALQYLLQSKGDKPARAREARWWDFLADFQNLKVVYKPGMHNIVADALSRCPYYTGEIKASEATCANMLNEILMPGLLAVEEVGGQQGIPAMRIGNESWKLAYEECEDFKEAWKETNESNGISNVQFRGAVREFMRKGNLLLIKIIGLWEICVPCNKVCRQYVMWTAHDHPTAGHVGSKKTYANLTKLYYWPGMALYTRLYIESWIPCRTSKSLSAKPAGLLQSISIPSQRWA